MAIDINTNPIDTTEINDGGNDTEVGNINVGTNNGNNVVQNTPAGLTTEELNDPNNIRVTISDPNTPIVVLYGPPSCGKTMTLVRMTRYLQSQGYSVVPDKTFRPTYDSNYRQLCENFDQMINSNQAATSTTNISFMLVKVLKNGKPVCQILEAPGEYYFSPDDPNRQYPTYVHTIIQSVNRKVWAVMVEPDWNDSIPRANYVSRIRSLKTMMSPRDKVIFVYNKIDLTPFVYGVGQVNTGEAIRNIQNLYPNIFVPFENKNPVTKFFTKYNCEFVP
ncbi:MAG: ATP-binding protein, partial [Prevotellaceae bacterium]|nr:ATP-binding protein [Candidatus Minthosoma caballi]